MPVWNERLFLILDAPAHTEAWTSGLAALTADSPIIVGPALMIALWVWGARERRAGLLATTAATLAALGVNAALGFFYFEPRPFMIGLGRTLIAHAPDNSFPSDHATFIWSLGAGLIATGSAPVVGAVVCLYGLAVAWARIYVGVHFPLDMIVSIPIAVCAAVLARALKPLVKRWALSPIDRLYVLVLSALKIPTAIAPR